MPEYDEQGNPKGALTAIIFGAEQNRKALDRANHPVRLDPVALAAAAEALCVGGDECDLKGECAACQHEAKWACHAYVEALNRDAVAAWDRALPGCCDRPVPEGETND